MEKATQTVLQDTARDVEIVDLRFRALLSDAEWASLPAPVHARFTDRVGKGETKVYAGVVTELRLSLAGHILVQLARLIGGPFPTSTDTGTASVVTVTETHGGQIWTRLYARRRGPPQVIHSTKLFTGPTGLEEHVGGGVCMRLSVRAENGNLVFRSNDYFLRLGRWRMPLPRILTPGPLTVTHAEIGGGRFAFHLDVVHPRLGALIHQTAIFRESKP